MLRVMKTPVLPTPALCKTGQRGQHRGQRQRMKIETFCFAGRHCAAGMYNLLQPVCVSSYKDQPYLPTVDRDRPILAELLLCFMYLANEIDEALS